MTHYNDLELEAMLTDAESVRVERKSTWSKSVATKAREAVCAFANDLPGGGRAGVLFVGAEDDGSASGLELTDRLLLTLTEMKTDGQIVPPPTLNVEVRRLGAAEFAVVTVEPADSPPVRYRGRIWVRSGPRRGVATAQDERILSEKRRYGDKPFDARPIRGAGIADLSLTRFTEEYLPQAFAVDVLAANERSVEERLAALKMINSVLDPTPTAVGLLTLSLRVRDFIPGAYVQFLRVDGTDMSDVISDELLAQGPAASVVSQIEEKLGAHNRKRVEFKEGARERAAWSYPPEALQQLLRNAIMHRAYEVTHAPVRVTWFDERVEIVSPGGPFGLVSVEGFGTPGLTDYRNPNLAESMWVQGLVQRFGAGIETARRSLSRNGNPPLEYEVTVSFVRAVVRLS